MRPICHILYSAALVLLLPAPAPSGGFADANKLSVRRSEAPARHASRFLVQEGAAGNAKDVAILPDGRQIAGTVQTTTHGRVVFESSDLEAPLPLDEIERVVFPDDATAVLPTYPLRRVLLWGDEVLTGHLTELDADSVTFDLAAGNRVTVPRTALAGYRDPRGEATLVYHDFEGPDGAALRAAGWTWSGNVVPLDAAQARSGEQSLALSEAPQTVTYSLAVPLEDGRVELSFFDDFSQHEELEWLLELEFEDSAGTIHLRPLLGWNRRTYDCEVAAEGMAPPTVQVQPLTRSEGWHRLSVSLHRGRLLGAIDRAELVSGRLPEVRLTAVRLVRRSNREADAAGTVRGGGLVAPGEPQPTARIDDFKLVAYVAPLDHVREHRDQDAAVLVLGDELFGEILSLDDAGVRMRVADARPQAPAEVSIPWPEIRAVYFRRRTSEAAAVSGLIVDVRVDVLAPAAARDPLWDDEDRLTGALVELDEDRLVIEHAYLGRIALSRRLGARLEVLFEGTQVMLDPAHHHLGDEIRPDLSLAMPEGSQLAAVVHLDEVPAGEPFVSVVVLGMEGMQPGADFRAELEAGDLRTYAVVNDQEVDFLNRHIEDPAGDPQRIRIPVSRELLIAGENRIALRQRPRADDPNDFDDCIVHGLSLEFEVARGD